MMLDFLGWAGGAGGGGCVDALTGTELGLNVSPGGDIGRLAVTDDWDGVN